MSINLNFDNTITTNFGANAPSFLAASNHAASTLSANFSDPIRVNIDVRSVAGTGTLASTSTPVYGVTYANMVSALSADAKTSDDTVAMGARGSITASDPSGGADVWLLTRAQRKALGLAADDPYTDGTITIGAGYTYDYDPSDGITTGRYDLVGIMMHEISEAMGRIGLAGTSIDGGTDAMLFDAFSYSGAGTRSMTAGAGNFFSIDNGVTSLKAFNNQTGSGGDSRDWAGGFNDSFNASSSAGVVNILSGTDLQVLDVIGYDRVSSAPEPPSALLFGCACIGFGLIWSRRTRGSARKSE